MNGEMKEKMNRASHSWRQSDLRRKSSLATPKGVSGTSSRNLRNKVSKAPPGSPAPWLALGIIIFFLAACAADNKKLAGQYALELQYYEYSFNFANRNMNQQAYESCTRTQILKSECFTTLVQSMLAKNISVPESYCNEIHPKEKMNMTQEAFRLVYGEIDPLLQKEIKEKLRPSKQRILQLEKIKGRCLQ